MKTNLLLAATSLLTTFSLHASEDPQLLQKIKDSQFNLIEAISYAEKTSGPATSAKFEMDGDTLVFSVYTAPQGLDVSAENTELTEIVGVATVLPITGKAEVFTDKEHLARASTHLTLIQLSSFSLKQVIQKALSVQPGVAYSVKNPMVRNHKAIAEVSILTANGLAVVVTVNLLNGKILKTK